MSVHTRARQLTANALKIVCCLAALLGAGCHRARADTSSSAFQGDAFKNTDLQQAQNTTMSFAGRYMTAMADAYDQAQPTVTTSTGRLMLQRCKSLAGIGALSNAVNPNPVVGLMDMAIMVSLTRAVSEEPWAVEMFGAKNSADIVAVLKAQETDIWDRMTFYLSPAQIAELHRIAARWLKEHPDQRYVASARLADFPESTTSAASNPNGIQLATSVFGIVKLDPFSGLDPAVRQVEESRILAERMFYYLQHMPQIISWQIDVLYYQMLDAPQITKLLNDTATVAGSTTRFTDSTKEFANVSGKFGETIEKFRTQLPDQQATLVKQLDALIAQQREAALQQVNGVIAVQRDAALKQATTQVSVERIATIEQLNATILGQQDQMTRNLQAVSDHSIDRMYERARALVLITVVAILVAILVYRLMPRRRI